MTTVEKPSHTEAKSFETENILPPPSTGITMETLNISITLLTNEFTMMRSEMKEMKNDMTTNFKEHETKMEVLKTTMEKQQTDQQAKFETKIDTLTDVLKKNIIQTRTNTTENEVLKATVIRQQALIEAITERLNKLDLGVQIA